MSLTYQGVFGPLGAPAAAAAAAPSLPVATGTRRLCFSDYFPAYPVAGWDVAGCEPVVDAVIADCIRPTECALEFGNPFLESNLACFNPVESDSRSAEDGYVLDWSEIRDDPGFGYAYHDEALVRMFIERTIAVIRWNLDLVRFTLCALSDLVDEAESPAVLQSCVLDLAEGNTPIPIRALARHTCGDPTAMGGNMARVMIYPATHSAWSSGYLTPWARAVGDEKFCLLVFHAATLLFGEGLHKCGEDKEHTTAEGNVARDCDITHASKGMFLELMAYRYPCLRGTGGCRGALAKPGRNLGRQGAFHPPGTATQPGPCGGGAFVAPRAGVG